MDLKKWWYGWPQLVWNRLTICRRRGHTYWSGGPCGWYACLHCGGAPIHVED